MQASHGAAFPHGSQAFSTLHGAGAHTAGFAHGAEQVVHGEAFGAGAQVVQGAGFGAGAQVVQGTEWTCFFGSHAVQGAGLSHFGAGVEHVAHELP